MANLYEMEAYVKRAYPGEAWRKKVNKMSDNQLMAIYFRLINKEEKTNRTISVDTVIHEYEQMSLF